MAASRTNTELDRHRGGADFDGRGVRKFGYEPGRAHPFDGIREHRDSSHLKWRSDRGRRLAA
jgi:hypothetical protein